MPNLELYFMRYYVLKNCDIFTNLMSKSGTCFESLSPGGECVSLALKKVELEENRHGNGTRMSRGTG